MKHKCDICRDEYHYTFRYLEKTYYLCGHHANLISKIIEQARKEN